MEMLSEKEKEYLREQYTPIIEGKWGGNDYVRAWCQDKITSLLGKKFIK